MKKITPLVFLWVLCIQAGFAQQLTHSLSQVIEDGNSVACNTRDTEGNIIYVNENTFYRHFDLDDFGITSSYDITSIDYGIELLENAPAGGFPVTVSIYAVNGVFPTGGLTLLTELTENLQDQTLTVRNVPLTATIPANDEFVVAISVPSDDPDDGGTGQIKFQIGSNNDGETDDSYLKASNCSLPIPATFTDQGRPDIHMVVNVNGNGATAGTGDLELVGFNYYPNPVKDQLFLKAKEEISSISIFNILGQQVLRKEISKIEETISLSSLSSGTYLVKAQVSDRTGSFKLVKE